LYSCNGLEIEVNGKESANRPAHNMAVGEGKGTAYIW